VQPAAVRAIKSVVMSGLDEPNLERAMTAERDSPQLRQLFQSPMSAKDSEHSLKNETCLANRATEEHGQ
jgi:hypothetical protein